MFAVFCVRRGMGDLGRDREFFRYVEGDVAARILGRTHYALTELDPAANPYLQWILTGQHIGVLPFALREGNFEAIRRNLDKLEWRQAALEDVTERDSPFDCFNLSDVFEYISEQNYPQQLQSIISFATKTTR